MRTNPVAAADLRASVGSPTALRRWAVVLGVLALVLYAWWPRGSLAWNLRTATPPQTFAAVTIALFLMTGYLNARAGGEEPAGGDGTGLADLVALTPFPVAAVVAGRLAAAAVTVLFQLALGLPFLLAALGVSGVSASVLPAVAAVVAGSGLAWGACGLALRLALPAHPVLRDVLLLAASAVYLAATFVVLPAVNPLAALADLTGGATRGVVVAGASLPLFAVSVIIAVVVLLAAAAVSAAALRAARRTATEGMVDGRSGSGPRG